jgi:hypothetical protein
MFRCFIGAIFGEYSTSLLNCCPMLWKRNGMRVVYCDRLCGGMLWDEGCILWQSVWWDVMGWGLYIVTVCVVGCYGMRAVYCDCLCVGCYGMRTVYCDHLCGGMLWDEGCILWQSVWWVTSHHTDCHNIQLSSHSTFTTLGNNSSGSYWTPWRWHLWSAETCSSELMC